MRIIGGEFRSRRLIPPADEQTTRPITDRVKQALFDRLWDAGLLEEGAAVDAFAGTGSLGLEALSRGVEHCTFIERDRDSRQRLEKNIAALGVQDRTLVLKVDALTAGWLNALPHRPLRLFFCDPPYRLTDDERSRGQVLSLLAAVAPHLIPGGVCILRTEKHIDAESVEGFESPKRHVYGSMALHFYQTPLEEEAENAAS